MDISVVIPVFSELGALSALHRALADAFDRLPQSAEIVFAGDGSTDRWADRLDAIAETDPRVRVLHMSPITGKLPLDGGDSEKQRRRHHPMGGAGENV